MLPNWWPPVCHLKARRTRTASRLKGKEAVHKVRDILSRQLLGGQAGSGGLVKSVMVELKE